MFRDSERPLYEIKASLFKGLAHPYRIRILEILSACDETSVSVMADETGLEQSHLSQHLAVLRHHQLVSSERRGSVVFYRLAYPQVADLLRAARSLLAEMIGASANQQSAIDELPALPQPRTGGVPS